MKNLIEYIEEGLLSGQDTTISRGDALVEDMYKLQYNFAYLSNIPWHNKNSIVGGMRGIYKKYFIKNVPTLKTDRHSTLQSLADNPERIHTYNKLDVDGDYLAAYLLQVELDKPIEQYDFFDSIKDKHYLEDKLNEHLSKILNDEGKKYLKIYLDEYFRGGSQKILTIMIDTDDKSDFKSNKFYVSMTIIKFNYTEGQYYYR